MHLIYVDESGQTGTNLNDPNQPIFVLAALIVPEEKWVNLEKDLNTVVDQFFPEPRPEPFEIHAKAIRNGEGYFRTFEVNHRVIFWVEFMKKAQDHELKLVYRAIAKKRFLRWVRETFGASIVLNPHVAAFPLVAQVVNKYLATLPGPPLGIFISDENREIISDVEKAIKFLRGTDGTLKLDRIIEKGFFIDSAKSLALQLCDVCAYSARKKEEKKAGIPIQPMDKTFIDLIEPLIHRGEESLQDVLNWLTRQKKSGQG